MKVFKLFFCVLALTLVGCKDNTTGDLRIPQARDDMEYIVPFRGEFTQTIDLSGGLLECGIPSLFNIQGKASYLGTFKGGSLKVFSCHINPETGVLSGTVKGVFIGKENDEAYFIGTAYIYPDGSGRGYFDFDGGAGEWKAINGWFATSSKSIEAGAAVVTADGEINVASLRNSY